MYSSQKFINTIGLETAVLYYTRRLRRCGVEIIKKPQIDFLENDKKEDNKNRGRQPEKKKTAEQFLSDNYNELSHFT